jgi:hypothetical protein
MNEIVMRLLSSECWIKLDLILHVGQNVNLGHPVFAAKPMAIFLPFAGETFQRRNFRNETLKLLLVLGSLREVLLDVLSVVVIAKSLP